MATLGFWKTKRLCGGSSWPRHWPRVTVDLDRVFPHKGHETRARGSGTRLQGEGMEPV